MNKTYPLDIQNVGGDTYILMSKGHHDPHEFMRKAREEGYSWPLGFPTHQWVKVTPARDGHWYHLVPEGTKGAFPATYAHEAYNERRYEEVVARGENPLAGSSAQTPESVTQPTTI